MNAGSDLETMPLTGVAIYANGNINVKEAKNLSTNSQDVERKLIDEALEEANKAGITLVSSDSDDDTDDSDSDSDTISTSTTSTTSSTSSTNSSVYTNIDEETTLIPTEVIINGHTYDVTATIPNAITQRDTFTDPNAIIISYSFDGHNYNLELKQDSISVYKDGVKYPHDITTGDIQQRNYHYHEEQGHGEHNLNCIKINDVQTGGYPSDRLLQIDHHNIGILDIVIDSNGNTGQMYSSEFGKYYHQNGTYIFSQYDYQGNLRTDSNCANFSVDTVTSISQTESTSTQDDTTNDTTNNTTQKEVTIQEYVEKYYKENVGRTSIRGSIYSKEGNININGQGKNFNVTGALITGNGNLSISNVLHVNLTYDPDYVPFFEDQGILTTTIFESTF